MTRDDVTSGAGQVLLDDDADFWPDQDDEPGGPQLGEPLEAQRGDGRVGSACRPSLPFTTALELCDEVPVEPEWIVEGYVARGAITELSAKIKLGKTHFALDLAASVLAGRDFLGCRTTPVRVLYLTEERRPTFRSSLARVGIDHDSRFHLLLRQDAGRLSWSIVGNEVQKMALAEGIGLVICDTLGDWASMTGDSENDAGAGLAAMRPLQALAAEGLAVLVCRHERKGGGPVGDAARGSSAIGGATDVMMSLQRMQGHGHEDRRELTAVGRFDSVPPKLIVGLVEDHYVALGTEGDLAHQDARRSVLEILPGCRDEAIPEKEIIKSSSAARPTVQRVLKELQDEGKVCREKGIAGVDARAWAYWSSS